jgi:hypothetical protein
MAGRRHIQDVVAEKMRAQAVQQRLDQQGKGRGTVAHDTITAEGGVIGGGATHSPAKRMQKNRNTIGHKEFFQVWLDR